MVCGGCASNLDDAETFVIVGNLKEIPAGWLATLSSNCGLAIWDCIARVGTMDRLNGKNDKKSVHVIANH
jgi:hypothetical protein